MHIPVLLHEVLDYLDLKPGMTILDATAGGGGHSKHILRRITPGGRLIALDRDPEAVNRIKKVLSEYMEDVVAVNSNFSEIDNIFCDIGIDKINGALFDLGMSSFQIDNAKRGFSFLEDGPLDMRFDKSQDLDAYYVINRFPGNDIARIISDYGEERYARRVASAIVEARKKKTVETTLELAGIIERAIGKKYYKQKLHPAVRSFQGIRIYVNDELNSVEKALHSIIARLEKKARLCVISFHSLEDRIVKNTFREKAREKELLICTKKPLRPGRDEIRGNSRARSAKLRVAEKI